MSHGSQAASLGAFNSKNQVLVISAPAANASVDEQRRIFWSAADGMARRDIVLSEALDDSERSRQIRSRVSADGKRFQVFLVGKDGHTALSSNKPLSAESRDEIRRSRQAISAVPSMTVTVSNGKPFA
ncbi:DUF4174 domain-containing protein [Bradyrhizobium embrapense]